MNAQTYKAAVDAVSFRPDFVPDTLSLLEARRKEKASLKQLPWKTICIAAALVAALALTVSAALVLLSPAQVAKEAGYDALADAFSRQTGAEVNETRTVGDYQVTLEGLLSGKDLDGGDVDKSQTYAVLAFRRTDGNAITDNVPDLTATPLVEGFSPWEVNAWTLSGGVNSFAQDGVLYLLFSCDDLAPYADQPIYLAVYPGTHKTPDNQLFSFDPQTGAIAFQPGQEGALFPLELDG